MVLAMLNVPFRRVSTLCSNNMYRMIALVTHYKIPKSKENYGAMMLFPTRTSIYRRRMYVLHVINTGHRTVVNDTLRVLQRKASTGTGE